MPTVLVCAPYMIAPLDRFRPGLEKHGLGLIDAGGSGAA